MTTQMNIFGHNYSLWLTAEELALFRRPIAPGTWGGNQHAVDRLQKREHLGGLLMTDEELCDAYTKAWAYGDGTWQVYFRVVEQAGRRAGWKPPANLTDDVWKRRTDVLERHL